MLCDHEVTHFVGMNTVAEVLRLTFCQREQVNRLDLPVRCGFLQDRADFIPVCPEIECGLLVPRPPMHLEVSSKGTRIKITESGEEVTEQMREWGLCKLDKLARLDIDAYIFKARSPSCGLKSTKICNAAGRCINENGNGIFTAMVLRSFPKLRVCQEDDFQSVLECFLD